MSNYLQISKITAFEKGSRNTQSTNQAEGKRPMERAKERKEPWKLCADPIYALKCCLLFSLGCGFLGSVCNCWGFAEGGSSFEHILPSFAHENTLTRQLLEVYFY